MSIEQAFSIRRRRVSGCLAESSQLMKSLRAIGVRSLHLAFATGSAASASRRSVGAPGSDSSTAGLGFPEISFIRDFLALPGELVHTRVGFAEGISGPNGTFHNSPALGAGLRCAWNFVLQGRLMQGTVARGRRDHFRHWSAPRMRCPCRTRGFPKHPDPGTPCRDLMSRSVGTKSDWV